MAEIIARGMPKDDRRISYEAAGYMELAEAEKDSDCAKVSVPGGVSSELGCCNFYEPQAKFTKSFKCGVCDYLVLK